jgi:hypothetical protein
MTAADHPFEPWTYPSTVPPKTICIWWEDGRICDRPEDEHAPAAEDGGAEGDS